MEVVGPWLMQRAGSIPGLEQPVRRRACGSSGAAACGAGGGWPGNGGAGKGREGALGVDVETVFLRAVLTSLAEGGHESAPAIGLAQPHTLRVPASVHDRAGAKSLSRSDEAA
jgi:hypothetical protein